MKLTARGRQALEIIRARPGITAAAFAEAFWHLDHVSDIGPKMIAAQTYLEQLVDAGTVSKSIRFGRHGHLYTLTEAGADALK